MLSKKEIEALLQNPKPIVRKANAQDLALIEQFAKSHPAQLSEELQIIINQLQDYEMEVTEETEAYIAFSFLKKSRESLYVLNDSWFMTIPKKL